MDDAEYIRERLDFPDCQIALRVDREVRSPDGEILLADSRYFTSSLDPASVTPAGLQSYVRDHWQVDSLSVGVLTQRRQAAKPPSRKGTQIVWFLIAVRM